jgi:hypothetical protein
LINIACESFGLGTLEALFLGTPVLWLNQWWTQEIVWPHQWVLIHDTDHQTLVRWIQMMMQTSRDHEMIEKITHERYKNHQTTKYFAHCIA